MSASERNAVTGGRWALALALGAVFGFWLSWVTFTSYDTIWDMLMPQDGYPWAVFAAGAGLSILGVRLLKFTGARTWLDGAPVGWSMPPFSRDHVLGAVVFGLGWSIAGACPGPALAQLGRGSFSGGFILAGIAAGVVLSDLKK